MNEWVVREHKKIPKDRKSETMAATRTLKVVAFSKTRQLKI